MGPHHIHKLTEWLQIAVLICQIISPVSIVGSLAYIWKTMQAEVVEELVSKNELMSVVWQRQLSRNFAGQWLAFPEAIPQNYSTTLKGGIQRSMQSSSLRSVQLHSSVSHKVLKYHSYDWLIGAVKKNTRKVATTTTTTFEYWEKSLLFSGRVVCWLLMTTLF